MNDPKQITSHSAQPTATGHDAQQVDGCSQEPSIPAPPPSKRPPRTAGWPAIAAVLLAFGVALAIGVAFGDRLSEGFDKAWHAAGFGTHELVQKTNADGTIYWTCGMHPWIVLPEPGNCPICGMELVPLDPAKFTGNLTIDPTVVQNIGVRTAPVTTGPLVKSVRTVGNVTYDETRVTDVNIKFAGWIDGLKVDSVGAPVKQGDVLFNIYSPELYSAQEEYLLAFRNAKTAAPAVAETNRQLLASARTRLKFFDLSEEQIAALEQRGEPAKTVAVRSPYAGVVIDKMATEGMQVTPGMRVYRIADLSHVWVLTTVYEQQLPFVRQGQSATMTLSYLPGETFTGQVVYVYPYVNEKTRQATVRLQFDNAKGSLKPGMYAQVTLQNVLGEQATLAPQSAVMPTGKRELAIVSLGKGRFDPREVTTGVQNDDGMVQILSGLRPGEQVVTSGQFLLDSEARMREALAKMIKGNPAAEQKPASVTVPTAASMPAQALPPAAAEQIGGLLTPYLRIGQTLAADQLQGSHAPADELAAAADHAPALADAHAAELVTIRDQARAIAKATDIKQARRDYAVVSDALERLVLATGVPASFDRPVYAFTCGFLKGTPQNGMWLQLGEDPRNPLMGEASGMIDCHVDEKTRRLPVTGVPSGGATTSPAS